MTRLYLAAYESKAALNQWLDFAKTNKQMNSMLVSGDVILIEGDLPLGLVEWCISRGLHLQSIQAGCLCCLGGPVLKTQVVRALRQHRPSAILVIGGTQARLSDLADSLCSPLLDAHLTLEELVWIVSTPEASFENERACTMRFTAKSSQITGDLIYQSSFLPGGLVIHQWPRSMVFDRKLMIAVQKSGHLHPNVQVVLRTSRSWYVFQHDGQLLESHWRLNSQIVQCPSSQLTNLGFSRKAIEINELIASVESAIQSV